jgi:hypothetical protein
MKQNIEIRYPTRAERRRAMRLAALVVLIVTALLPLLWVLDGYITSIGNLGREDAMAAIGQLVYILAILLILLSGGTATWTWRWARRIRASGQYPPADMKIIRPVRIRRGKAAVQIARIISFCSLLLLLLGFLTAVLLVRIVDMMAGYI